MIKFRPIRRLLKRLQFITPFLLAPLFTFSFAGTNPQAPASPRRRPCRLTGSVIAVMERGVGGVRES
jgi:hypothetical protein